VEPPFAEVAHVGGTCLHLDHVPPVIDEFAPALDGPLAGRGDTAHPVPAQPEAVARVDDEGRGVDITVGIEKTQDRAGRRRGRVDGWGAQWHAGPAPMSYGNHCRRHCGQPQDNSYQDGRIHRLSTPGSLCIATGQPSRSSRVDPLEVVMAYTWLCM
jgi:hypothetical protein